jgi:hypothetical protein
LLYQYKVGLTKKLKDALAISNQKQDTLDDLQASAVDMDQCMHANTTEQIISEGCTLPCGHNTIIDAYMKKGDQDAAAPHDPNAMDVDATNIMASILNPEQKKKWAEMMKDCPVKKDKFKCKHCTLTGHNMRAYLCCFAGHPCGPPPTCCAAVVCVEEEEAGSKEEPEFLEPEPLVKPAEPTEMVSVAATTDGKKKCQHKKKPATSNPGAKALDTASVALALSSALPPKPMEKSLFGGGPSLALGSWAATIETAKQHCAEKQQLQRDIAALKACLAESDKDDDSEYLPCRNF